MIMEEQDKKNKKGNRSNLALTGLFLVLVFGISIASMVNPVRAFSENENRYLAQSPEFSLKRLYSGEFTSDYETFITDQFVARDTWIGLKTMTERAMQKQDINGVYFGKDGYLIEKHSDADIDQETADRNAGRLVDFVKKYSELLGEDRVHAMIVPTASEILKDKLPPFAAGYDQETYVEQIASQLPENSLVNVGQVLKNHSSEYIFYRTDHHWTSLGAFYAYQEWAAACGFQPMAEEDFEIETVTDEFYGTIYSKVNVDVKPDEIKLYRTGLPYSVIYNMDGKVKDGLYDWEKLETKDKYAVYLGGNNALVQIDTQAGNGRKLLIIKDSFAHSFAPFAVNHFEQTYMVDFRYFNMPISKFIEQNGITDILVLYNAVNFATDNNTLSFTK